MPISPSKYMNGRPWTRVAAFVLIINCLVSCTDVTLPTEENAGGANNAAFVMSAMPEQVEAGKAIVGLQCIGCHAVRSEDTSRNPAAPALRTLAERYPVTGLAEAFAQGVLTGHPSMPNFRFSPEQIDAILAYLQSIQTRQAAALSSTRPGALQLAASVY